MHLVGGPHALLQMCAWAGMLVSYSQETGFAQATVDTFSGKKPCALCRKIAQSKKEDASQPNAPAPRKLSIRDAMPEMIPADELARLLQAASLYIPPSFMEMPGSRGRLLDAPPLPPPCVA